MVKEKTLKKNSTLRNVETVNGASVTLKLVLRVVSYLLAYIVVNSKLECCDRTCGGRQRLKHLLSALDNPWLVYVC